MPTIHVFPNPYGALDHKGRLAGACHDMVSGGFIGASKSVVPGSLNANEKDGRGPGGPLGVKADIAWSFDVVDPIKVTIDASQSAYYVSRNRSDDVFTCVDPQSLPLERLARARNLALAKWAAAYGDAELDTKAWAAQFPLDEVVAELAKAIAAREPKAPTADEVKADRAKLADAAKAKRDEMIAKIKAAALELAQPKASAPAGDTPTTPTGDTPTTEPMTTKPKGK